MAAPADDPIDLAYKLLKKRANSRGASSNINPNQFNQFWNRAELKFFNAEYKAYAQTQVISDSISKWMSDPQYIPIDATGRFNFFTGMNLIHVDSMNAYIPATASTGQINGFTITPGTTYTNGTYNISLTGGAGTGAAATVTVTGGVVTLVILTNPGIGYTVNDNLTGTIPVGSGWKIVVTKIAQSIPNQVKRVEKEFVAANLSSTYDAPSSDFPIYTQYSTWFQFYPITSGIAQMVYLKQPIYSYWNYLMQGNISTFTGLTGGSAYTTGTYTNVPLTGGLGNSALATIVVSAGAVTSVTITNIGKLYAIGDQLSALAANIGGTGTGFHITISSIINPRPIYTSTGSVQPLWNDNDISTIVDLALEDVALANRDPELQNFAQGAEQKTQ
jgi:hypothetical protein